MSEDKKIIKTQHNGKKTKLKVVRSIDDFNLSEFPIAPLVKHTKSLANSEDTVEWLDNKGRSCYYTRKYGDTVPNNDTEDILLLLVYLLQKSDDPYTLSTSSYKILKLKGVQNKPNKYQIKRVIEHLEALYQMEIETNYNFDRVNNKWRNSKSRIIADFSYETEGAGEYTYKKITESGEEVRISKKVEQKLKSVTFNPEFIKTFLNDPIKLDLNIYFSLEDPTPKRIYRYANKYVNQLGDHSKDLQKFAYINIGMRGAMVEKKENARKLAHRLKPHIARVNQTEEVFIEIRREKKCESGYLISFHKPQKKLLKATKTDGFKGNEKVAYNDLIKHGVYPSPAKKIVLDYRKRLHRMGGDYITFAINKASTYFEQRAIKPKGPNYGGLIKTAICDDWFFSEFMELHSKRKKRNTKKEKEQLANSEIKDVIDSLNANPDKKPLEQKEKTFQEIVLNQYKTFDFAKFKIDHNEVYERILENRVVYYQSNAMIMKLSKKDVQTMLQKAVRHFCQQCFDAYKRGEKDFFPNLD